MAKSLVLGNGTLTVGFDRFAQVKDCYFDYVGLENHMSEESVHRIGVWVDGSFSWFSDGSWQFDISYEDESMIGRTIAKSEKLQIEIVITDCVYNEKAVFIRDFSITNKSEVDREVRLFLNHEFRMYGVRKGDTVYFDPNNKAIVHYKGRRVAVISAMSGDEAFSDYTVGLSTIEGREGTWKDAEDGHLSKNSIEHGTVDSTIGCSVKIPKNDSATVVCWTVFSKDLEEALSLNEYVSRRSPGRLIETTRDFWTAWVNKIPYNFKDLPDSIVSQFKKSLFILRIHVGENGEAVASVDADMLQWGRDTYTYVWPRDGAYLAMALDRANYSEVSRRFFDFCNEVISEEGFFYHKYRPDKSLGSSWHGWVGDGESIQLPIQEDETALVLISLWNHYEKTKDIEYIEKIYNSMIKKAGNFLLGFRDEKGLPFASYDLWEMKMGVHTFTVSTVYEGLRSAERFADLLGKDYEADAYRKAAEEVKVASEVLWKENLALYGKSYGDSDGALPRDNAADASSFYGVWKYKLCAEERVGLFYQTMVDKLFCREGAGGILRFEDDAYFRSNPSSIGNPWIITTAWQAQYLISKAKDVSQLKEAADILSWIQNKSLRSGILPEQLDPVTAMPLSATPLAWSHAEFVVTVLDYLEKHSELSGESHLPETEKAE
jgi:glucoamylase